MAKNGGKRPGAGRPKGSRTLVNIIDYFSDKEIKDFFEDLKVRAKDDNKIAIFLGEHLAGKAVQPVSGDQGGAIPVQIVGFNYVNSIPNANDNAKS